MSDDKYQTTGQTNNCQVDPLTFEDIQYSGLCSHQYVYLECSGMVKPYSTTDLWEWVQRQTIHPETRRPLFQREIEYINFKKQALDTLGTEIPKMYDTYSSGRKQHAFEDFDDQTKLQIRASIKIDDMAKHFRDYLESPGVERYEREAANKRLLQEPVGFWLLRRSSVNRINPELFKRLGIDFYAFSFSYYTKGQKKVSHQLFIHALGHGWSRRSNAWLMNQQQFTDIHFNLVFDNSDWYTNFVDLLESILEKYKLEFYRHDPDYYCTTNLYV